MAYPNHITALVLGLRNSLPVRSAYAGLRIDHFLQGQIARTDELDQPFQRSKPGCPNCIPINAVLFERPLLDKGCCFDENLAALEGWDFLLQMSLHTGFLHLDQVSAVRRSYGDSGFGVSNGSVYLLQSTATILQKWKSIWSGIQCGEVVSYIDSKREQSERMHAALEQGLDERQAGLDQRTELSPSLEARSADQHRRLADIDQLNVALATQLATRDTEVAHGRQFGHHPSVGAVGAVDRLA